MITADLSDIFTLKQFNTEIRRIHEEKHGEGYCDIHDAIFRFMKGCDSYKELGVNQGGTASAGLLCNPKRVELVDLTLARYNEFLRPIAQGYSEMNNIELVSREIDSTSPRCVTQDFDVLLIDSYHKGAHLRKELDLHKKHTNKYIIMHDTNHHPNGLREEVLRFCRTNPWEVADEGKTNVGYMVIGKK
jgi:hypothetical protein